MAIGSFGINIAFNIAIVIVSIVLLWKGADKLVESASKIAAKFGISELVIGLTIVAFGTSAPEMAVSVSAALSNQADISVGNVVGSNIFNIGFILGIVAMIRPIDADKKLVYRDGLFMIATTFLLFFFMRDLKLVRYEGIILLAVLIAYVVFLFIKKDHTSDEEETAKATAVDWLILPLSIAAVVAGGELLVRSASFLAEAVGVSPWIIGITIVAAGTSAPEMATSIAAAVKGRYGISAGNLVGSNIFNILGVLGVAGAISPLDMSSQPETMISMVLLTALMILSVIFMRTEWKVSRLEGAFLVCLGLAIWIRDIIN